ncbi:MAG: cytochrome c [Bacteroidota bacterium]
MKLFIVSVLLLLGACGAYLQLSYEGDELDQEVGVYKVLRQLGEKPVNHELETYDSLMVSQGRALIFTGQMNSPQTGKTSVISPFFTCINCHNTDREDPDLRNATPENRLQFVSQKRQGFFQATTFWGIVNRESWFNDDYVKKYGEEAQAAQKSLREAIQLCSRECSQGRELTEEEMKAVLAYFWSLQLKLSDLALTEEQLSELTSVPKSKKERKKKIEWIKSQYMLASSAHIGNSPENKATGFGLKGDKENGRLIYRRSCRLCHYYNVAEITQIYEGGDAIGKMVKAMADNADYTLYEIIRNGTHPGKKKEQYMPYYPVERMSNQQIEDLRAYFESVVEREE